MFRVNFGAFLGLATCFAGLSAWASGQATSPSLSVRTLAEVETRVTEQGREVVHLAPADRVEPGDEVKYTVEARNTGLSPLRLPVIVQPIPEHTRYVANSAAGPGVEIRFSIDGGTTFDRPENLKIADGKGRMRMAKAAEYTHIRWRLRNALNPNSVAYARFRAFVK